jgi:poly(ADP-ribose) glycohydrolase ARH3
LLGAMIGDVVGAAVEAESPGYIAATYRSIDDILATESVEEFNAPNWKVGRYTDDTQMTICVAEWLLSEPPRLPKELLARFHCAHERWRRYGAGTEMILGAYAQHPSHWAELSTMMFPHGSYGNGSAMRVAPIGLICLNNANALRTLAIDSSRPTHSHPLAYQGAVLQAMAVANATHANRLSVDEFLRPMRAELQRFADLLQDISKFTAALDVIEQGIGRGASCGEMSKVLGTGIEVYEAVPMTLYCFLRNSDSFERVIHDAVFVGGDTDTIASMAGAIAGAYLGKSAIPERWLCAVREDKYPPSTIEKLADDLFAKHAADQASPSSRRT